MEWPNHFPEGCPPDDADDAHGMVFRLVDGDDPTLDDFQSWYERNPRRSWGDALCRACGLSVLRDLDDAKALRRRIPSLKTKRIAAADLQPTMGKVQQTSSKHASTHHTWWPPTTIEPPSLFAVVGES